MDFTGQDPSRWWPFLSVAVVAISVGLVRILGPIAKAFADRIRGGVAGADAALAVEVDHLRGQLAEFEERLDFAERLLAQAREADQLPGGTHR